MQFHKMNGAGNDFIILNNLDGQIPREQLPLLAKTLCERHLSIGADGLMVVVPATDGGDYRMLFYNSDGSMGEMCGNGARCICRYGHEMGLAGAVQQVETTAGLVTGYRIDRRQYKIRLNDPTTLKLQYPVTLNGTVYAGSYVELGSPGLPHAVIPMDRLAEKANRELFDLGRGLRYHTAYPKGANVNFWELVGPDHVLIKTYERGVEDFTYACGTGTGSTVTVLTLLGLVSGENVHVTMPGGELYVTVDRDGGQVVNLWLTGPTNMVCNGVITDESLF
ncbi:MAG: diaminopimelate epimerase [Oscillospiraceae bacterium]|nr:diaminopimelate epimerase [Oscillospiraceae bacterium]